MEKINKNNIKEIIKKVNIILIVFILSFSLFFSLFVFVNNQNKIENNTVKVNNGFKVEIKDIVIENKLYRYIIVFENDVLFLIKLCDHRITHEQEKTLCMKDRKII